VAVAKDRRRIGGAVRRTNLADDERALAERHQLGLAAAAADLVRDPLGCPHDVLCVRRIGADRGDAQQLRELVEPGLLQDAHAGESSHARPPPARQPE
jgi:hypothetical protein